MGFTLQKYCVEKSNLSNSIEADRTVLEWVKLEKFSNLDTSTLYSLALAISLQVKLTVTLCSVSVLTGAIN
jgi:hypothetical protein